MAGTISPIYDAEAEALKRQMAFANALRDKGMQGNTGSGYQSGRVYIVGNPLGNIASSIGGAILANRAEEGQRGLELPASAARSLPIAPKRGSAGWNSGWGRNARTG